MSRATLPRAIYNRHLSWLLLCSACGGRSLPDELVSNAGGSGSSLGDSGGGISNGDGDGDGDGDEKTNGNGGNPAVGGTGGWTASAGGFSAGGLSSIGGFTGTGSTSAGGASPAGGASSGGSGGAFCNFGQYDTDTTDAVLTCEPWTTCQPGTYQSASGNTDRDRVCTVCPEGTFTSSTSSFGCEDWKLCSFGEEIDQPATATNDVTCKAAELFAPQGEYGVNLVGMTTTSQAIYLMNSYGNYGYDGGELNRYTLDGESLEPWRFDAEGTQIGDLAHLGDDLYAVGFTQYEPFLSKFDPTGQLVWQQALVNDGALFYAPRVSAIDGAIFVESEMWYDSDDNSYVLLEKFSPDGELIWKKTFNFGDTYYARVLDFEVATDGHAYLSGVNYSNSYTGFILEFDELGELLSVHSAEALQCKICFALSRDKLGHVYAIGRWRDPATGYESGTILNGLGADGEHFLQKLVALQPGDELSQFVVADGGIYLLGRQPNDTLFLKLDMNGDELSRSGTGETKSGWAYQVSEAPDGRVFFGGEVYTSLGLSVFAAPWPD